MGFPEMLLFFNFKINSAGMWLPSLVLRMQNQCLRTQQPPYETRQEALTEGAVQSPCPPQPLPWRLPMGLPVTREETPDH